MARLIVAAEAQNFAKLALPGNQQRIRILVSVTNANGAPPGKSLDESNFDLRAFPPDQGDGFSLVIDIVTPQNQPTPETSPFNGFYLVEASPPQKWAAGRYLFAVRAHRPAGRGSLDRGQAVAALAIP